MRIRRHTARVLPVDREGRVLLLIGRGLFRRGEPFLMSVGGGLARGETLTQTAARELREEPGSRSIRPGSAVLSERLS